MCNKSENICLGHTITGEVIFLGKQRIEGVSDMPDPTNAKELQRLLQSWPKYFRQTSFFMKYHLMGKVLFLFFKNFLLVLTKF